MANANEAFDSPSPLNSALKAGIQAISRSETVTFTKYVRFVLPLDGFVFWVNAGIIPTNTTMYDSSQLIARVKQTPPRYLNGPVTVDVDGSFHYATETMQNEDETYDRNTMIFTAESDIDPFNEIGTRVMYIGVHDGVRFAFSQRAPLFAEAGIYHYRGFAIYPAMESQIIDRPEDLNLTSVVVSNSLPIWLSLDKFMPVFPSFLSDANLDPPYATVEIPVESMEPLQATPYIDHDSSQWQLVSETVRVTIYGLRNDDVLDFLRYVQEYTLSADAAMGIMNIPIPRDEKRTQSELKIIAMKKTIEFRINYYQTRIRDIARRLILNAVANVYPE
ncbi:hypothetical protein [Martelella alba]|uniref:Uncharacterized protein n=1 Tax=Martelella alba TaxID=2590451 RepID=A0ABY2SFF0_9HYPH|nr:hypothetical protein [Martelella alba]TKI02737.1 hypothetical protein FCN80_24150 [Martelella alba]